MSLLLIAGLGLPISFWWAKVNGPGGGGGSVGTGSDELREDGGFELREDGGIEVRE